MFVIYFLHLVLIISDSVFSKTLPPNLKKCSISDPNLGQCLDSVVIEDMKKLALGNKELGIVQLEPLQVKKIELEGSESGPVRIHQLYENVNFHGLTNATLSDSDVSFSDDNCHWNFKSITGKVIMEAHYKMTGQLLLFPINGNGKCRTILEEVESTFKTKCEKYMKKNKKHIRVTEFDYKFSPKKVTFDFENVIDGNEQLSREVVKTVNENAFAVYSDVGPAFNDILAKVYKDTIHQVYSRVPQDDLFLP